MAPRQRLEDFEEELARNKGGIGIKKKITPKKKGQWSYEALHLAIDALHTRYGMQEVSNK